MNPDNSQKWTKEKLERLVAEKAEESSQLEFKSCDSLVIGNDTKKKNASIVVSSFANSNGGTLIYGIIEENHIAKEIDTGYDQKDISKEWLDSVIHDNIKPPIKEILIHTIRLSETEGAKVVYVVSIPKGETCHQAGDNRYYRRLNARNYPLEHWEIEEIKDRAKKPKVEVSFFATRTSPTGTGQYLNIQLINTGGIRAKDLKVSFTLPRFQNLQIKGIKKQEISIPSDDGPINATEYSIQRSDQVLFPQDICNLTDNDQYSFMFTQDTQPKLLDILCIDSLFLTWKLYVDDMEPKEGKIQIGDIEGLHG